MPFPAYRLPNVVQPKPEPPTRMRGLLEGRVFGYDMPGAGLLQPAVFDRLRNERGMGLLGSEGEGVARPRGGSARTTVTPKRFKWTEQGRDHGVAETKSGLRVTVERDIWGGGPGSAEVSFFPKRTSTTYEGMMRENAKEEAGKSMKRGLERFSDVYRVIDDFLKMNPGTKEIKFSGISDEHDRIYAKFAPKLAKELGGAYTFSNGYFRIILPRR